VWPDNETERDFLNFSGVADTVAEIIRQADGRPTSIGISGSWGAGKSSMIKLVRSAVAKGDTATPKKFVFVEFNAWLYQGYDDARAALLEEIATKLNDEADARKTGTEKAKELLRRVNWLRAAKLSAGSALALSLGLPPIGMIGDVVGLGKSLASGIDVEDIEKGGKVATDVAKETQGLLKPKPELSPPKEIHAIRECFKEALQEMGITLVVLIDDLDRCLPPTTISTLEAIRLFLFLENTAFVIAADDAMIKHAVRQHFGGVDEDLVINYFDKLIQIPIRVPPLGTQEVRAYMMLLFVENSGMDASVREDFREKVCQQLAQSWRGKRVDKAFMQTIRSGLPPDLIHRFDTADRLAPLMTQASQIAGNPRLVKRFLNALSIRMAISHAQGVGVDEAALAKMLLFERCGNPKAYDVLTASVNQDANGKPHFLKKWEEAAVAGDKVELDPPWDDPFTREWLTIPPQLAAMDLRGVLYVSREHAPLVTPEDRLSSEGAELLAATLEHPDMASSLKERLVSLPRTETAIIMDRLLERARQEQEWGAPPILDACITLASADPSQGPRVGAFLAERPPTQIKPSIVPKIGDQPWSSIPFDAWRNSAQIAPPVKAAISRQTK
tara:strand:+ start:5137 stop:6981 length:1845 start_codon:yes stop_codon:yes gene_type:complete